MAAMESDPKPFVAPCRELSPGAPFEWLKAGWKDYRAAPGLSLAWGLFCWFLSTVITWLAWQDRWLGAAASACCPASCSSARCWRFGMYSVSRQLCLGHKPTLAQTLRAAWRPLSNSLVFALVVLVILLLWARAGAMVHIFFPTDGTVKLKELTVFLTIGSAVGSIFAAITFAASVFSLPFIANRDVDVVTAVVSSINAVLRNRWTMLLWGAAGRGSDV